MALVMTDYRMPEMSGMELLENVKYIYPDTIRIICSGHIDQGVLMKAISEVQVHEILPGSDHGGIGQWVIRAIHESPIESLVVENLAQILAAIELCEG